MEFPVFLLDATAGLALALGAFIAAGVMTAVLTIRRRGRLCPRCGSTTVLLVPSFPLTLLGGRVLPRWCSGCNWKGLAPRPSHERMGRDGRIHLKGSFRWGSQSPPPRPFFRWSGNVEEPGRGENESPPPSSIPFKWKGEDDAPDAGGPEPEIPFEWGNAAADPPPSPPSIPFKFAGDEPPPLPFQFAEEDPEPEEDVQDPEEPPRIPFRFADQDEEGRRRPDPGKIKPRLGFRWRG